MADHPHTTALKEILQYATTARYPLVTECAALAKKALDTPVVDGRCSGCGRTTLRRPARCEYCDLFAGMEVPRG